MPMSKMASEGSVDHIYALIEFKIKYNVPVGQDTFAAFTYVQQAFDWVDRYVLFCKLLYNNISGKMYQAETSMYGINNTNACVKCDM